MRYRNILGAAVGLTACLVCANAWAQGAERPSYLQQPEAAPSNAVEVEVATGYTQGFGMIRGGGGQNVKDVAKAGIGFDLGVGYRISPEIAIGVGGQYQEFQRGDLLGDGTAARGVAADVHGTWHFAPYTRFDPFVKASAGYRMLWEVHDAPGVNTLSHGFKLIGANVGFDLRTTPDVAVGPMIGADLDLFLWQKPENGANFAIPSSDVRLSTFIYGGLQGRFDIGGARTHETMMTNTASR